MPAIDKQVAAAHEPEWLPWSLVGQHMSLFLAVACFGFYLVFSLPDSFSEEFTLTVSQTTSNKARYICGDGNCYALAPFDGDWNAYLAFFRSVKKGQKLSVRVNNLDVIATLSRDGVPIVGLKDYYDWERESQQRWRAISGGFLMAFMGLWLYRKMTD
jgi:hypothetical protein